MPNVPGPPLCQAQVTSRAWGEIDDVLRGGGGLPGGDSLAGLLLRSVGVLNAPAAEVTPVAYGGRQGGGKRREVLALRASLLPPAVRYLGRCDPLILAPRERHRQGTRVELS